MLQLRARLLRAGELLLQRQPSAAAAAAVSGARRAASSQLPLPSEDEIHLEGLRFHAYHGVLPEERALGAWSHAATAAVRTCGADDAAAACSRNDRAPAGVWTVATCPTLNAPHCPRAAWRAR